MHVLIVDDEENLRTSLKRYLVSEGWTVSEASNGLAARRLLEESSFDAVALDLRMPGMDGMQLLSWLNSEGPAVPVVMMSAYGDVGDAVNAMKAGAADYLVKPFDPEELVIRLKRASGTVYRFRTVPESDTGHPLSRDPLMKPVMELLERAAPTDATILITGESGTGKEVAARWAHRRSTRSQGPFLPVNLGGLPENLVESELFGYEKGAFTGAEGRKIGLFEAASGGTIFLDEIGELQPTLQVKLLRVLQDRKIQRLGGVGIIPVDVRIIAATNRNLEDEVARGRFRDDLYYRINVIRVNLPPLRERPADIPYLAGLFLEGMKARGRTGEITLSPGAIETLSNYPFPGNVRELENLIERAVILSDSGVLQPRDFPLTALAPANLSGRSGTLMDMEIALIRDALYRNEGHRERTAIELGITRKTLLNKMKSYGIAPPNSR